jgi:hypothetical protein
MKKFVIALIMAAALGAPVFTEESSIAGTFRNDREHQTFTFNADGTFIMAGDAEDVQRAMEEELSSGGAVDGEWTDRLAGTYTVKGRTVEMVIAMDGRENKMRMTIRDRDTLRMFFTNYKRVRGETR